MTARKIAQENGWPALGASLRELHSVNDYLVQAVHGLLNRPTTAPPGPGFAGEGVWWAILPVQPEVLRLTQEDGRRIKAAHIRRGKELSVNVCPIIAGCRAYRRVDLQWTYLTARIPSIRCDACWVKKAREPWAREGERLRRRPKPDSDGASGTQPYSPSVNRADAQSSS